MAKIRKATVHDVPEILPLVRAYWRFEGMDHFDEGRVGSQLERLLSEPRLGVGWLAESDGRVIGYLLAVLVFSLEHLGMTAEIDEFFVRGEGRGSGVGSELLVVAESELKDLGCTNISLQLGRQNAPARRFYRRHGYVERSGFELLDKMMEKD